MAGTPLLLNSPRRRGFSKLRLLVCLYELTVLVVIIVGAHRERRVDNQ